jgi:hypothetical protein
MLTHTFSFLNILATLNDAFPDLPLSCSLPLAGIGWCLQRMYADRLDK